jgi:hypothetical protein
MPTEPAYPPNASNAAPSNPPPQSEQDSVNFGLANTLSHSGVASVAGGAAMGLTAGLLADGILEHENDNHESRHHHVEILFSLSSRANLRGGVQNLAQSHPGPSFAGTGQSAMLKPSLLPAVVWGPYRVDVFGV